MNDFIWPTVRDPVVSLLLPDHPCMLLTLAQILDHARAGRMALKADRIVEAKYYCECCAERLWRLGVDGLTEKGEVRWNAAKYEVRLPGRLSSAAARHIRGLKANVERAQSFFEKKLKCEHIVPRRCVPDALICSDSWDLEDEEGGRQFLLAHGKVAIITPPEDERLTSAGFKRTMPREWWAAPLAEKANLVLLRYERCNPPIVVTPWQTENGASS